MKRADDFQERRKHLANMTDEELFNHFWAVTEQVVDPLLELGRKNTTPSVERAVLMRMGVSSLDTQKIVNHCMGISSMDTKAIVEGCMDKGLMGKGAGHVVYKLAKAKGIEIKEAAALLAAGEAWDEAAALFK